MTQHDAAARGWRFEPVSVASRNEQAADRSADLATDDHVLAFLYDCHNALTCECLLENFEQWLSLEPPAVALGLRPDDGALLGWCEPQQQRNTAGRSRPDQTNHRGSGR